jgi:hypothetical protein
VAAIGVIRESPDRKLSIEHFGHRDIGNPGDKRFGHFRIVKSETPIRREVPLWEPAVSIAENRDSKDR